MSLVNILKQILKILDFKFLSNKICQNVQMNENKWSYIRELSPYICIESRFKNWGKGNYKETIQYKLGKETVDGYKVP